MFNLYLTCAVTAGLLLSSTLNGLTLKESVVEALNTNPIVQERLKNYRATQQDLNIAESDYYPSLDFSASVGYTSAGQFKDSQDSDWNHRVIDSEYNNYETSLTLTQNLFEGFSTKHKVNYQEARILAAGYNYVEKSNDIAFRMTTVYINVLRAYDLLGTARENVQINELIFKKVKSLYNAGLTTDSEVKKIESSLSLAKANLIVGLNNTRDAEFNFRRLLGRMPDSKNLEKVNLDIAMPQSIQRASLYAINHNPSLLVSTYNIKGAESLWKENKKGFYPRIDLELSQNYDDSNIRNQFNQPDDRFKARIVLSYNLFRGGADSAISQKNISKINQEVEIKRDLKRQVIEGLDLSWSAYELIDLQLKELRNYQAFSEKTLELYKEEFDLGRRSLLDLLASQNDVINSRTQIIGAEYDQLLAKYRILDAMGLLTLAVIGDTSEYMSKVNLPTPADISEVLDYLPIKLDVDNDNVVDNQDLCDNSLATNSIMPYGCIKIQKDRDSDGIIDSKDECPLTPSATEVYPNGCALDSDDDSILDYEDKCSNTPLGYIVNQHGCATSTTITTNFKKGSVILPVEMSDAIEKLTTYMQNNLDYNARIIGHTNGDKSKNLAHHLSISKQRAIQVKKRLVENGIDEKRLSTVGNGYEDPISNTDTVEGSYLNRRIEIEFSK